MYTSDALLDVHERAHRSLHAVLEHCATLPEEDLQKRVEGFSYPTLVSQLHHLIAAERYWFSVLAGDPRTDDDAAEHVTIDALRALRASVADTTAAYLRDASDDALSAPRSITKWTGDTVDVVPAHVLLRTQTHIYQHQGEIASMLRLLGHRFPSGLDFPL